MRIAVEGCLHGELDKIYEITAEMQVDLLIVCGDFQANRNLQDLEQMSVPQKFRKLGDFHDYYTGKKVATVPTVFIGGNHESSAYLWELYHGGFVCPNIYFLGHCGLINFGGLRIGGISGIFKRYHYNAGYPEKQPFDQVDARSIYHVRQYCVFKMSQLMHPQLVDLMLSHDWPRGIVSHGNKKRLLERKKFLSSEIQNNTLGSFPAEYLLNHLKPKYWFSGHMHIKFAALVKHQDKTATRFLALDKCLRGREFLQVLMLNKVLDIECPDEPPEFKFDPEWLAIVKAADPYFTTDKACRLPNQETFEQELQRAREWVDANVSDLTLPTFAMTAPPEDTGKVYENPQTTYLCNLLGIPNHFNAAPSGAQNPEEIAISDIDSD